MAKTIEELKAQSAEVKNASVVGENTATRVGTLFTDIVEHQEMFETQQAQKDAQQSGELESKLTAETDRAKAAEQANTAAIAAEVERAKAAEKENAEALSNETTRAEAAEKELTDALAAETNARTVDISNETVDRNKAIAELYKALHDESDRAMEAESSIIIYAKYKQSTVPSSDIGDDGDYAIIILNKANQRVYKKINGVWTKMPYSNARLYRNEDKIYFKSGLNDSDPFIEVKNNVPDLSYQADMSETKSSEVSFIKNNWQVTGKATEEFKPDGSHEYIDDREWIAIKKSAPGVFDKFITSEKDCILSFAPILRAEKDGRITISIYDNTDKQYVQNNYPNATTSPQQFFIKQDIIAGHEYRARIQADSGIGLQLKNPLYYHLGATPAYILSKYSVDELQTLKNSFLERSCILALTNFKVKTLTTFSEVNIIKDCGISSIYIYVKANVTCNFRVYDAKIKEIYASGKDTDLSNGLSIVINVTDKIDYSTIKFRTEVLTTIEELTVYVGNTIKEGAIYKKEIVNWTDKVYSTYGDSVSAGNNGNFSKPYDLFDNKSNWGLLVSDYMNFSKFYGRSVGGQAFKWYGGGGSVVFVDSTGNAISRNDSYNYDNYEGNVDVPEGTTPARGCACSWLRITTQYPESIKDSISVITIMYHNDYHPTYDYSENVEFIEGSEADPEWKASSYYEKYNGDYNINTTKGAIASTVFKMQVWMPNAIIVLCTPCSGRMDSNVGGNTIDMSLKSNMVSLAKAVKDVAYMMSIPCIDVYGTCGINGINRDGYIIDSIHPTIEGGKMLARAIIGGLKSIVAKL